MIAAGVSGQPAHDGSKADPKHDAPPSNHSLMQIVRAPEVREPLRESQIATILSIEAPLWASWLPSLLWYF